MERALQKGVRTLNGSAPAVRSQPTADVDRHFKRVQLSKVSVKGGRGVG